MSKGSKAAKEEKKLIIIMFASNKIHNQQTSRIEMQFNKSSSEEEKVIDNKHNIEAGSDCGCISDIKQECQKLSTEEIIQNVVSELTGNDIK